ncbi:MAG: lysophospholipid acyltransferase family protein [Candidatus Omnitrophica bacterium]|nr:lysophospholipid acyltransferase family protein [Candidatus Omnitrophota bacterium]
MLFFILYKIGEFVALALPIQISYKMACLVSDVKYFFSLRERRQMIENLRCILPDKDVKTLKRHSRQIFCNFSMYLVDFLRFKKLNLRYVREHIKITGINNVDEAIKRGKGAILMSAHIGNWELGGALMGILGYPINVLALDHKNKLVNNFFISQRSINNEKIISVAFGVRKCLHALSNNEFVAIVSDKNYVHQGAVVKFFGKDTLLPKGPATFSIKTGAVIVPSYMVRTGGDHFELILEKPIEYAARGDFENDVKGLTQLCARALEDCIRKYPTQWYCFERFWMGP